MTSVTIVMVKRVVVLLAPPAVADVDWRATEKRPRIDGPLPQKKLFTIYSEEQS